MEDDYEIIQYSLIFVIIIFDIKMGPRLIRSIIPKNFILISQLDYHVHNTVCGEEFCTA